MVHHNQLSGYIIASSLDSWYWYRFYGSSGQNQTSSRMPCLASRTHSHVSSFVGSDVGMCTILRNVYSHHHLLEMNKLRKMTSYLSWRNCVSVEVELSTFSTIDVWVESRTMNRENKEHFCVLTLDRPWTARIRKLSALLFLFEK